MKQGQLFYKPNGSHGYYHRLSRLTGRFDKVTEHQIGDEIYYVKANVIDRVVLSEFTCYNVWKIQKASEEEY